MKKLGIYIHIPFCVQKCLYCDFCSFSGAESSLMRDYTQKLSAEIKKCGGRAEGYTVDTVYFGGGTPTLLHISEFERIFNSLEESFAIYGGAEITCECNPATADREKLEALRALGVNRMSIGLQSANEEELRALGRIHSYSDFVDTYRAARLAGFDNISADVMYGIPNQTRKSLAFTLERLCGLDPEHISVYGLKIEDGTPFGKMRDGLALPDEDEEYGMYFDCADRLSAFGYDKYEISNFAHKGYESRHNMKYWLGEDYLGFGVSAHSYFEGERYANSRDMERYLKGEDITAERRAVSEKEKKTELVMLGMRLGRGIVFEEFRVRAGEDFLSIYGEKLKPYVKDGFVTLTDKSAAFTDKGFLVSNYILSDILDFEDRN